MPGSFLEVCQVFYFLGGVHCLYIFYELRACYTFYFFFTRRVDIGEINLICIAVRESGNKLVPQMLGS